MNCSVELEGSRSIPGHCNQAKRAGPAIDYCHCGVHCADVTDLGLPTLCRAWPLLHANTPIRVPDEHTLWMKAFQDSGVPEHWVTGMVVHSFNPSIEEAEAGRPLGPAWST